MAHYLFAFIPFLLAFAYRARGGAISLGPGNTNLARLFFWALPVGIICIFIAYVAHVPPHFIPWLGFVCAAMAFGGACIGHSTEQTNTITAYIGMGAITMVMLMMILLPFLVLFQPHLFWVGAFGLLGAPASWLGYQMKVHFSIDDHIWCTPGDSSWEEFFIGFFAFGVPLMLLGLQLP